MTTTTARTTHEVGTSYSDIITSIPEAAAASGFARHFKGREVEIIKGGAMKPDDNMQGIPLREGGEEWCETDHIWAICRSRAGATIGFDLIS